MIVPKICWSILRGKMTLYLIFSLQWPTWPIQSRSCNIRLSCVVVCCAMGCIFPPTVFFRWPVSLGTVFNCFPPFSTVCNGFNLFSTVFNSFQTIITVSNCFQPFSTIFIPFTVFTVLTW